MLLGVLYIVICFILKRLKSKIRSRSIYSDFFAGIKSLRRFRQKTFHPRSSAWDQAADRLTGNNPHARFTVYAQKTWPSHLFASGQVICVMINKFRTWRKFIVYANGPIRTGFDNSRQPQFFTRMMHSLANLFSAREINKQFEENVGRERLAEEAQVKSKLTSIQKEKSTNIDWLNWM